MKIIQFCQLYYPAIHGGGENLFLDYARELVRQGHDVSVITQRLKNSKKFEILDGIKIYRVGLPIQYKGHLSTNPITNLSYLISSFKLGLKLKADIIHSNLFIPAVSAQAVSKIRKIPHIMSVFDYYSKGDFWKKWSKQGMFFSRIFGPLIENFVLSLKPTAIHTISEASKKDIEKIVKSPIYIIPCAINTSKFKNRYKTKNQFCYIGRHVFYKNVDTIIKAMPHILQDINVKFYIIGDGPMRKQWEDLALKYGVNGSVVFLGRVSEKEKLKILGQSKFLVNPSIIEGFGIVLLEAWAMNKPVIVSNVPPLNDLVNKHDGGLCVPPFSPKAWANAIKKYLKSPPKKDFRKIAKKYDIKVIVKDLISLFQKIVNQKN